jgi:histidine triad (HIT) family protein
MAECIFCRIIKGEIPCAKLYEDDRVLSFLDIGPINPGHALVIPKRHSETLMEADPEDLEACIAACQKIGKAVLKGVEASGMNLLQNNGRVAGQVVEHIHFHLIPRKGGDGFFTGWPAKSYPPGELEKTLEKVKVAMKSA